MNHRSTFRAVIYSGVFFSLCCWATPGFSLLVGNWNVNNRPNTAEQNQDLSTIAGFVDSTLGTPDIWAVQETDTASTQTLLSTLTGALPGSSYSGVESASDGGGDRTALVYNQQAVELLSWTTVTDGLIHYATLGSFRSLTEPTADPFHVMSVHLKSGSSTVDKTIRRDEALLLRQALGSLDGQDVILAGDFNLLGADETGTALTSNAWEVFTGSGNSQLHDVADAQGSWRDNEDFRDLHTQNPGSSMDDRFDLQFGSTNLFDGVGWDYLDGSYSVLGNNGTHDLNGSILTGTGADAATLNALAGFSDHLPVFASYVLVPEPATALLLGLSMVIFGRRRA